MESEWVYACEGCHGLCEATFITTLSQVPLGLHSSPSVKMWTSSSAVRIVIMKRDQLHTITSGRALPQI